MEELNRKLDNNMITIYFLFALAMSVLVIYLIFTMFSYRHTIIDGKYYKALHIQFPGHTTHYKPAHTIDLSKWSGSGINGIKVEVDGKENPEIEASMVLKAIGWADSTYVLEKNGEHFVLVSPEKSWEVWDWGAYHRIGKWILDEK